MTEDIPEKDNGQNHNDGEMDKTFIDPVKPRDPGETLNEDPDSTMISPARPMDPGKTLKDDMDQTVISPVRPLAPGATLKEAPGATLRMTSEQVQYLWGATLQPDTSPGATLKLQADERTIREKNVPAAAETRTTFVKSKVDYPQDLNVLPPGASPVSGNGNYEVLRLLGQGGMGMVYEARQASLDRNVVLKMVLPRYSGNSAAEDNFIREALVTGDLDHPNIVPVHELGKDGAGNTFMAMKYVKGESWKDLLHSGKNRKQDKELSLRDHLEILLKVCDAMAFAHDQGIIHRDLKPENIMVGSYGEVLVMDWGVAVSIAGAPSEHRTIPAASVSAPAGTPCYMAPEMARGEGDRIGVASDIYLLGAILYELLTGTPPHRGSSVTDVLKNASAGTIEPPENRIDGSVPGDLSRTALKALSPLPEDRYPDVKTFAEQIRSYLEHEESLQISEQGLKLLGKLKTENEIPREERYAVFQEALNLFTQAVNMYPGNENALKGQAEAAVLYSDEAITRGDTGLASAQIPLLENNSFSDRDKLETLKATVKARERSRVMTLLVAGAVCIAMFLLYKGFSFAVRQYRDPYAAESRITEADTKIADEWKKIRQREYERVDWSGRQITRSEPRPVDSSEFTEGLFTIKAVLHWKNREYDRLYSHLASGDDFDTEAGRVQAQLAEIPGLVIPEQKMFTSDIWNFIADIARYGADPGVLENALTTAENALPAETPRQIFRNRLLSCAVWGLWLKSAEFRKDPRVTELRNSKAIPYELSRPPLGVPLKETPGKAFVSVKRFTRIKEKTKGKSTSREHGRKKGDPITEFAAESDFYWSAFNDVTGEKLWDLHPSLVFVYYADEMPDPVPLADGTVMIAAPGVLYRAAPVTGEIIALRYIDGIPLCMWPDPADRETLIILLQTSGYSGYSHTIRIQNSEFDFPRFSTDEIMINGAVLTLAERRLDFLYEKAVEQLGRGTHRNITKDPEGLKVMVSLVASSGVLKPFIAMKLLQNCRDSDYTDLSGNSSLAALAAMVDIDPRTGIPPMQYTRIGSQLELAGFPKQADLLYEQGLQRFIELDGNPDLNPVLITAPAAPLRWSGRKLWESGMRQRALELVEKGRSFTSYMEGDHRFYRTYADWLKKDGNSGPVPLSEIRKRIDGSVEAGGVFLTPARFVVVLDIIIMALVLNPFLILAMVIRTWKESRQTRIADLYSRGIRTFPDRVAAFLTRPFIRIRYTFFAYMPRFDRATLAALCLFQVLGMGYIAGSIIMISRAAGTKLYFGNGLPGTYPAVSHLEDLAKSGKNTPENSALLAEGLRAQNRMKDAFRILKSMKDHGENPELESFRLNNLGVCFETQGDTKQAEQFYRKAAELKADGAGVAQANLLRMEGKAPEGILPSLSSRDRWEITNTSSGKPFWALCSFDTLAAILDTKGTSADRLKIGLQKAFMEGRIAYIGAVFGTQAGGDDVLNLVWLLVVPTTVLSLIWLPFPVLKADKTSETGKAPGFPRLRSVLRRIFRAPGWVVPGYSQLLWGKLPVGGLILVVTILSFGVSKTIYDGGIIGAVAEIGMGGYFEGVQSPYHYPELSGFAIAARTAFWVLIVLNILWAAGSFFIKKQKDEPEYLE